MIPLQKDIIDHQNEGKPVRINKYLSDAGFCSRREADRLVEVGKVFINGIPALMGQKVNDSDVVTVDGKTIETDNEFILLALNKPVGIECTASKDNPDNIVDFVHFEKRVYPVGRLDKNSSGLILLTNAGELVNKILKASNYHEKEYEVRVNKKINDAFIESMKNGIEIELNDGTKKVVTRKCEVFKVDNQTFRIILTQGYNRQIRRMCKALSYEVVSLKRLRIINIELGDLPSGKFRTVTKEETEKLLSRL